MRGRLITFEGGEGTGKSTHTALLADRLKSLGIAVVRTREPGGSPGAEAIRHVLLSGAAKPLGPEAEAILFAAARDDHVRTTIEPALQRGAWVISDRFIDSTRVYQGTLGQVDPKLIRALERATVGDISAGSDGRARRAGRGRTGARAQAPRRQRHRPVRGRSRSAFHEELREAYRRIVLERTATLRPDRRDPAQGRGRGAHLAGRQRAPPSCVRDRPRWRARRRERRRPTNLRPSAPRATTALFGHRDAEVTLLDAYRTGRLPHAWLITGPPGIGKATLAYRMARFVLAHPDPHAPEVRRRHARSRSRPIIRSRAASRRRRSPICWC